MGLMDAFTADERVELKVGELYDVLRVAASNEKTAQFLKNAVECEVPYRYIREVITGKKEEKKGFDGMRVEIPSSILDKVIEEAKKAAERVEFAEQGAPNHDEGIKDCAPENVSCDECARDIAGMADEPSEEESEGGEE